MANASIKIDTDKCKSCRLCIMYCRPGCIRLSEDINALGFHPAEYTGSGCTGCLSCALMCPDTVIEVYKEN